MPNGIAVTRITQMYLNPPNVWANAGVGNEKPKFENEPTSLAKFRSPYPSPNRLEPQAITVPTAMATSPPGTPPKYFTPPNQLARITAKQITPITGAVNTWAAGLIEINVIEMPASEPSSAARGVIWRT